jgi:hypothetical protein
MLEQLGDKMEIAIPYSRSYVVSTAINSSNVIEAPKIGEDFIATSAFGSSMPLVYGTDRVPGVTFWTTTKEKHIHHIKENEDQEFWTASRAISIAWGPILGIRRVWRDDELVVDAGQALPGALYLGTSSQLQDPLIQSFEGTNIPAFRGRAYMVIFDEFLATGEFPNYSFEVVYGDV